MPTGTQKDAGRNSKKNHSVTVKFTSEQLRLIDQSAKRCGVKMARWMRHILMQAATRQPNEGYLRIREPNGATE
jgi:predicted DNA binding CopG/RHH family protein